MDDNLFEQHGTPEHGEKCPHCGAKVVRYRHRMSKGLAGIMGIMFDKRAKGGYHMHFDDLGLNRSQCQNLPKLQYFGAVYQADNYKNSGRWCLTIAGEAFITGRRAMPEVVETYRGELVGSSDKLVMIGDLGDDPPMTRQDYAEQGAPGLPTAAPADTS